MTGGQQKAIQRLFEQTYPALLALVRCEYGDCPEAEDIVQEAFRVACQKPEDVLSARDAEVWMIHTVRNMIYNRQRADARWNWRMLPIEEWTAQELAYYTIEEKMGPPDQFPGIKEENLRMFYRMALDGETAADEAKRLCISLDACQKRFQRTRDQLAEYISRHL